MRAPILFCFALLVMASQKKPLAAHTNNITITFDHFIDTAVLQLNTSYKNQFNEAFTPKTLRYYISKIAFNDASGKQLIIADSCFLIDESLEESKTIRLSIHSGTYSSMQFLLGVDSAAAVNGVQEGALDPYNGMYWTWNTGYVSAKFEGTSPVSRSPQQLFQYHIGGFRSGQNTLRWVTIPMGQLTLSKKQTGSINIQADILKWFGGVNQLSIANNSFVHTPGKLAVQYADNYATMFSLRSVSVK